MNNLLDGEKAYSIYNVEAKWSEGIGDRNVSGFPDRCFDGSPDGRIWNGTGWYDMPREPKTIDEIAHLAQEEWWPKYKVSGARNLDDLADLKITVEFKREEVWCLSWFAHWTWDVGLDDSQVLESFTQYVERTQLLDDFCLMGAEDRYRWKGSTTGKEGAEETDPPCRCPCCKERDVIIIGH